MSMYKMRMGKTRKRILQLTVIIAKCSLLAIKIVAIILLLSAIVNKSPFVQGKGLTNEDTWRENVSLEKPLITHHFSIFFSVYFVCWLFSALRGFPLGTSVFPSPQKLAFDCI